MLFIMILKALFVTLACGAGVAAGWWFSRRRHPYWLLGYGVALLILVLIALPGNIISLGFIFPFSLVMAGRTEFVLSGIAAAVMLATLVWKAPKRSYRILLTVLMVLAVGQYSIMPFVMPALLIPRHRAMVTSMSPDRVCLQTTDYTCGPAAAVTVLRRLGFEAEEGAVAIQCATGPTSGTQPDWLAEGLMELYGAQGLRCEHRMFKSLEELRQVPGLTIAQIKFGLLVDHWVAVLEVREDLVIVGDPLPGKGLRAFTYEDFLAVWRKCGVVCWREGDREPECTQ